MLHEYPFLLDLIHKLETQDLQMQDQINMLQEAKKLTGFANEKLQKSLAKNPDLVSVNKRGHGLSVEGEVCFSYFSGHREILLSMQ